jgi:hypothetical protein
MTGSKKPPTWADVIEKHSWLNDLRQDQRTVAERKWQSGSWIKVKVPQKPCDVGLFSDDHKQEELF